MRLKSLTMKEIVRSDTADETAKVFFFRGNRKMNFNKLIPELSVTDINRTREFYVDVLGFKICY